MLTTAVNWSMGHICFLYLAMLLLNLLFCVMVMRACLWVTHKACGDDRDSSQDNTEAESILQRQNSCLSPQQPTDDLNSSCVCSTGCSSLLHEEGLQLWYELSKRRNRCHLISQVCIVDR